MAPKPSYQLLIWSFPTVAFLLTCLWYRRKRSSLRSDPGGTASADLTKLPSKTQDSSRELPVVQTANKCESTKPIEADEKLVHFPAEHSEQEEIFKDLLKTVDDSVTTIKEKNFNTSEKINDRQDKSVVQDNVELLQIITPVKAEFVLQDTDILESHQTNSQVSEHEESEEETVCEANSEEESSLNCPSDVEADCEETERSESREKTTLNYDREKSEQVESIRSEQLSEKLSGDKIDFVNLQQAQESVLASKPTSSTVSHPEQLAEEELCVSSSDSCIVTNGAEPDCIEEETRCTVFPCEDCGVSDSALTKQSSASTSVLVDEASCSNSSIEIQRTVMARKSSVDLAMEKSTDTDGSATAHRECKLDASEQSSDGTENVQVERDSANHSPADVMLGSPGDVMLGSPAISNYSDANSEGSSDSGKGCSDMATPPPRTPVNGSSFVGDVPSIFEFVLPQHLVGRLIGRYGAFVHQIKDKTNASILIKRHPDTTKLKICAIEGNQMSIDRALEMIRDKFPQKKYPNVTLEQVCFVPATPVFQVPQCVQLRLVEGVNNDVIVSLMVTPAHVFLQQPTHPTFLNLSAQAAYMRACYTEPTVPALPRPVQADVICVAPVMDDWCRAQVVTDEAEDGTCTVRLLDYGGYNAIDCSLLRQIRHDFVLLPFQAAEAYLANVSPAGGAEEEWSQEAFDVLEELTKGQVVEAQVVGYAENAVPIVYLYSIVRSKAIFVNYELVKRGLAAWIEGCTAANVNGVAGNALAEECDQAIKVEQ